MSMFEKIEKIEKNGKSRKNRKNRKIEKIEKIEKKRKKLKNKKQHVFCNQQKSLKNHAVVTLFFPARGPVLPRPC